MPQITTNQLQQKITYPQLPLAVYREIAAHLRQVTDVQAQLIPLETDHFDYDHSQVGYLLLCYPETLAEADRQRVESILAFYGDRYGLPACHRLD